MFAYLHANLHASAFSSTQLSSKTCLSSGNDCSFFGDLFKPILSDPLHHYFEMDVPEFNLEGFQEDSTTSYPSDTFSPGSRKMSKDLASTEDAEMSPTISGEDASVDSQEVDHQPDLFSECKSVAKSACSLSKRSPKDKVDYPKQQSKCQEVSFNDYDLQAINQSKLVSAVIKLIDREPLSQADLESFDHDSLQLVSNFAFMMLGVELKACSLDVNLATLNEKMKSTKEKKKRNEERIKYVFKRVNKLLLTRFMSERHLSTEDDAMSQVLHFYFGSAMSQASVNKKTSYERYFTLLFKPSNMYRNDLKDVFGFKSYLHVFQDILSSEFLTDFKAKRAIKIEGYLKELKNEIFYSSDKSDPTILQQKISRLPWSIAEVSKGIDLFTQVFQDY